MGPMLLDRCCRRRKGEIKGIRAPNSCMTEPAPGSAPLQNDNASETPRVSFRGDTFTFSCYRARGCLRWTVAPRFVITPNRDSHQPALPLLSRPPASPCWEHAGEHGGWRGDCRVEWRFGAVRRYLASRFGPSEVHTFPSGRCFGSPDKIFPQNTPKTLTEPRTRVFPQPRPQERIASPTAGHRAGAQGQVMIHCPSGGQNRGQGMSPTHGDGVTSDTETM